MGLEAFNLRNWPEWGSTGSSVYRYFENKTHCSSIGFLVLGNGSLSPLKNKYSEY